MAFIKLGNLVVNSDLLAVVSPIDDDHAQIYMSGIETGFEIDITVEEAEKELDKIEQNALLELADKLKDEIGDHAKPKLSHAEVKFEHPASGTDHCIQCVHYNGVDDCEAVKPPIRPKDWCELFVKK